MTETKQAIIALLKEGRQVWADGRPRDRIDLTSVNLSGLDLSCYDLSKIDFSWSDMSNCDLSGSSLAGSTLYDTDLSSANLYSASLRYANLKCADLSKANLIKADLRDTTICGATIDGAVVHDEDIGGPGYILCALTDEEWQMVFRKRHNPEVQEEPMPEEHSLKRQVVSLRSYVHDKMREMEATVSKIRQCYDGTLRMVENLPEIAERTKPIPNLIREQGLLSQKVDMLSRQMGEAEEEKMPSRTIPEDSHEAARKCLQEEIKSLQEHAEDIYNEYRDKVAFYEGVEELRLRDTFNEHFNSVICSLEDLLDD